MASRRFDVTHDDREYVAAFLFVSAILIAAAQLPGASDGTVLLALPLAFAAWLPWSYLWARAQHRAWPGPIFETTRHRRGWLLLWAALFLAWTLPGAVLLDPAGARTAPGAVATFIWAGAGIEVSNLLANALRGTVAQR